MKKLVFAAALTLAATAVQAQGVNQNGRTAQGTGGSHQQTTPNNPQRDNNNGTSHATPSTGGTRNPKN
jgi:hypothetical protein